MVVEREGSLVLVDIRKLRDEDGVGFRLSVAIASGQYIRSVSDLDGLSTIQITSQVVDFSDPLLLGLCGCILL